MNEEPHIGNLIKEELERQGRSITWLAKQLGYSRQNAYKIFNRPWIYTDLLLKISDLLDYDFFKCYSDWRNSRKKECILWKNALYYEKVVILQAVGRGHGMKNELIIKT